MRTRGIESALKFAVAVALSASRPDHTLFVLTWVESGPTAVLFTVTVNAPAASAPDAVSRAPDVAAATNRTVTAVRTAVTDLSLGVVVILMSFLRMDRSGGSRELWSSPSTSRGLALSLDRGWCARGGS